jgi:1-aminocyclopropane-1-carboxylate deaminase/D-cysteine desulfhydrase-like pyridoxal-dependent ACC family enzyme
VNARNSSRAASLNSSRGSIAASPLFINSCSSRTVVVTERERETINVVASCEGLLLDPVYTGRAAAGMIDLIRTGFFKTNETVLFLHTGGQPALFAEKYADEFK